MKISRNGLLMMQMGNEQKGIKRRSPTPGKPVEDRLRAVQ